MTQVCRPAKCIEAIRVALLDPCTLLPVCGPLNGYVMGCIIDPEWSPEIEEGEESVVKDNCGNICLRDDRCDLTKRWNLEFKIKEPDKEFIALITGNPLIVEAGISIGVRHLSYGACSPFVFLEMFERTDDCQPDSDPIYYRHVFPAVRLIWTGNEREGIFRILQIEGKTRDVLTDSIGDGPFDDIPVGALVGASPSERIDYAWFEDDLLPVLQCGAIPVPCPDPVLLTATAPALSCEQFVLTGIDFGAVNHIELVGPGFDYYDPAGPDAGLNPGTATITTWNATTIDITDTAFAGQTVTGVHLWGVADTPDFGVTDVPDFVVDACPFVPLAGFVATDDSSGFGGVGASLGVGFDIDVDSVGRYVAATQVDDAGTPKAAVWRFLDTGLPDAAFGVGGLAVISAFTPTAYPYGVAVDLSDDSVYVVAQTGGAPNTQVAKLTSAGVLDVTFGVAGILTLAGTGSPVKDGIFVESTGNIVVGYNEVGAGFDLRRFDPTGAVVDLLSVSFRAADGFAPNNGDGLYAATWIDLGGVDRYVANLDIGAATVNEVAFTSPAGAPVQFTNGTLFGTVGVTVDVAGNIFLTGSNESPSFDAFTVVKFTPLLALDATFGVGGLVTVQGGGWVSPVGATSEPLLLAGGDVVLAGTFSDGLEVLPATARVDALGALVGTYGVGGIAEYNNTSPNPESAQIIASLLEEADGRAVHVGQWYDSVNAVNYLLIGRTLLATGLPDPTFG